MIAFIGRVVVYQRYGNKTALHRQPMPFLVVAASFALPVALGVIRSEFCIQVFFQVMALRKYIEADVIEPILIETIRDLVPGGVRFVRLESINEFIGHAVDGARLFRSLDKPRLIAQSYSSEITPFVGLNNGFCRYC